MCLVVDSGFIYDDKALCVNKMNFLYATEFAGDGYLFNGVLGLAPSDNVKESYVNQLYD